MQARSAVRFLALLSLVPGLAPVPAKSGQLLFVDDDGAQCPGALRTIKEAIAQATAGSTILVCPGTYQATVTIRGHDKDGIRVIALGGQDEVVVQGSHTEGDGFRLEDVDSVLVRGFTVREVGYVKTTASQFGVGCGFHVQNANYNTIEHNRITKIDMMGISVFSSANNVFRYNFISEIDPEGFGYGIYLDGLKSANNFIFQNFVYRQPGAGMVLTNAGPGNIVLDNDFSNNGQWGVLNQNTEGTWIEGNRLSYNAGAWGVNTTETDRRSMGIQLRKSNKVTVFDNTMRGNTAMDISWDGAGEISFANNACQTATHTGLCGR